MTKPAVFSRMSRARCVFCGRVVAMTGPVSEHAVVCQEHNSMLDRALARLTADVVALLDAREVAPQE